jgi:urease accessory protein UreF
LNLYFLELVHGMINQTTLAQQVVAEFLGDLAPLAERIGSSEGLVALSGATCSPRFEKVHDLTSLCCFVRDYHSRLLVPRELPAIWRARAHADRYEVKELIELDQCLASEPLLREFADASERIGKRQLNLLRPLRDQRLVQRYLRAVQAGEAHGWHTLVYGLILSLYSLPLRQGLLSYARQTTRGFVCAAARRLQLSDITCQELANNLASGLPSAVQSLLEPVADCRLVSHYNPGNHTAR